MFDFCNPMHEDYQQYKDEGYNGKKQEHKNDFFVVKRESNVRTKDDRNKFEQQYDDDIEDGHKGCWVRLFGWIPYVRWSQTDKHREDQPPDKTLWQPGIFSWRVLLDTVFLFWLGYLDAAPPKDDEFDPGPSMTAEYTNCGILSALLLSVYVEFFVEEIESVDGYVDLQNACNICWITAFGFSALATLMSVIMLLVINETGDPVERRHFVDVLDSATRGIGSHSPVIFLYASLGFALVAILLWLICIYGFNTVSISSVSILVAGGFCWLLFLLNSISSLYLARQTQAQMQHGPRTVISKAEIRNKLDEYIAVSKGFENIESEDDFISYLRIKKVNNGSYKIIYTETVMEIAREMFRHELKMYARSG